MADNSKDRQSKSVRLQMIIGFTILILVMVFLIVLIFSARMESALKNQTADMAEHLNSQLNSNVNSYMESIVDNIDVVADDDELSSCVSGNLTSKVYAQYDSKMRRYALMPVYEDFCICYSDGTYIGMLAEDTLDITHPYTYSYFVTALDKSESVWTTSVIHNRSRLYYACRINDKAIAIASIPITQFTDSFESSAFLTGMHSYLTDEALIIQCTNDTSVSAGSYLRTNIYKMAKREGGSEVSKDCVVVTAKLDNGWYTITSIPSSDILSSLRSTVAYVMIAAAIMVVIGAAYIIVMSSRFTSVMDERVEKLDVKAQTDLLTGLINKKSFEEIVSMALNDPEPGMDYALVFMDVDNFKHVNDRCGHDIGDEVLRSFSHTIGSVFRDSDVKGRIGGDEFCVMMKIPKSEKADTLEVVDDACRRFRDALYKKATSARQSLPAVTSSMGASIWGGVPEGFDELYHKADTALYASKKSGKNTWSIYGQNNVDESILKDQSN